MSEYQYHEWQAVDRVLTPEEQAAAEASPDLKKALSIDYRELIERLPR
jgi:hypothetical protein